MKLRRNQLDLETVLIQSVPSPFLVKDQKRRSQKGALCVSQEHSV